MPESNYLEVIIRDAYRNFNQDVLLKVNHVMERHAYIIRRLISSTSFNDPYNILEIGAHVGLSTIIYLREALNNDFSVSVIDPFDGKQQGTEEAYFEFKNRVSPYYKYLTHLRLSSMVAESIEYILSNKFMFAYVDGLHSYEAAKSDIRSCMFSGVYIICVDDVRGYGFSPGIRRAVDEWARDFNLVYSLIDSPENIQETYFIKKPIF